MLFSLRMHYSKNRPIRGRVPGRMRQFPCKIRFYLAYPPCLPHRTQSPRQPPHPHPQPRRRCIRTTQPAASPATINSTIQSPAPIYSSPPI